MKIYSETCSFLEKCFFNLEPFAPRPTPFKEEGVKFFRYIGKEPEAAIIQKLARYISSLNAALLLLNKGYIQELNVLFRTLDELLEDISFLSQACSGGESTPLHQQFLEQFFAEEFDNPNSAFLSSQNRPTVARKKIHASLADAGKANLNPSDAKQNNRTISQAYSGYVHGASVHLIEMISGNPPRYHLTGQIGSQWHKGSHDDYFNYAYRGLLAMLISSKVLGQDLIEKEVYEFREYFEKCTGDTGRGDPNELLKKMKRPNK